MRMSVWDGRTGTSPTAGPGPATKDWHAVEILAADRVLHQAPGWKKDAGDRSALAIGGRDLPTKRNKAIDRRVYASMPADEWLDSRQNALKPAGTILTRIEDAAARCSGGIFLFTKDDKLEPDDGKLQAAPRDNVVFEAGYFVHAKDKERVLIIREDGAKMPANLGGDIYLSLTDRSNIAPIEGPLRQFLEQQL